jgi:type II secretory pathway component PulC
MTVILGFLTWLVAKVRPYLTLRNLLYFIGTVGFLTGVILIYRACNKPQAVVIPEGSLQKINSQNAAERQQGLTEVVEANATTIETVAKDAVIADTAAEERNAEVDKKVAEADKKAAEAKRQDGDVTAEELTCLLMENC